MTVKKYNYLGKCTIEVDSNENYHKIIARNFEFNEKLNPTYGKIKIKNNSSKEIFFDKNFPYLEIKKNIEKSYPGVDHIRYGHLAKSIWKKNPLEYEVETWMKNDDWIFSKLFKKIYYEHPDSKTKSLIHSSGLKINRNGLLLVGPCWSGKTSLNVSFLSMIKGSKFLAEDEIFLSKSDNQLEANYLPGSIYARFSIYDQNKNLQKVLFDPSLLDSLQVFDSNVISRIINKKRYNLDLGLNLSRKKFCDLMGIESIEKTKINKIIFTEYSTKKIPSIKKLDKQKAIKYLKEREIFKDKSLNRIRKRTSKNNIKNSILKENFLENVELIKLSYDAKKHLSKTLLEDLL